jgi:hypothetical protein
MAGPELRGFIGRGMGADENGPAALPAERGRPHRPVRMKERGVGRNMLGD